MALYDDSPRFWPHDPGLAYDDQTGNLLPNAQFFVYASNEDAAADHNRLPVQSMDGLPLTVLQANAQGVIPRFQTTVIGGVIRAGDNYQQTFSAIGVATLVALLEQRVKTLETTGVVGGGTGGGTTDPGTGTDPSTDTNIDFGEYAFGDAPFGNN